MRNFHRRREKGSGLIIVILIVALLIGIGVPLLTLTGMSPKVSGSLRDHEEAFNAAEAGFDAARLAIEQYLANGQWTSFAGHTLTQPTGIDLPLDLNLNPNPFYFRLRTDAELLQSFDTNGDGTPEVANLLFFHQTYATDEQGGIDIRYTYTVFLIDDEASGGTADSSDAILVSIGTVRSGARVLDSVRLEIVLAFQTGGPNP